MFVEIYRPLDFDGNPAFTFDGENVGSPFLASGHDTCHIGLCRPAMGASRHNRDLLQVEMFFGFRGCSACPNSLMGEEPCTTARPFQRYMRGAARHPEMA